MSSATPQRPGADRLEKAVTAIVVSASALFVFWQLQPDLIFTNTTPTGGDMGAHVWGPAFLRDELIPQLRLTGWTPDWYSGFPAFHFYMVLPALAIVILDVGITPFVSIPIIVALLAGSMFNYYNGNRVLARRLFIAVAVLAPFIVALPYNIAFKLVAVSGVVLFPVAAWALGHFGGLRYPGPAVLSLASLAFAFDRSFNIYGGNIASTLAGEFAASISLSLSLVALGLVIRGTRTGEGRGWAAVFIALTGLCHLLPAFFLLGAVFMLMLIRMAQARFTAVPWLLISGTLAAMLSAFWVLPFYLRTDYLNDMGWERIEIIHSPLITRSDLNPANILSDYPPLPVLLVIAFIGLVLSLVRKVELGWVLGLTAVLMAVGFVWFPDGRLWNARILPFYYLSVSLLAGIGVYLLIHEVVKMPSVLRLGVAASSLILLTPSQIRGARVWPEPEFMKLENRFDELGPVLDYVGPAAGYATRVVCILLLAVLIGTELPRQLGRLFDRTEVTALLVALGVMVASPARDIFTSAPTQNRAFWFAVLVLAVTVAGLAIVSLVRRATATASGGPTAPMSIVESTPEVVSHSSSLELAQLDQADEIEPFSVAPPNSAAALLASPIGAMVAVFVLFGLALNSLGGISDEDGIRTWSLGPLEIGSNDNSFIPGWASWNFSGLQAKPEALNGAGDVGQGGWDEYAFVQRTMAGVGEQVGCGRAMWEFAPELNRYGTTMAMMLLPMWTDGCIGSMEGLYFEATPTVPYHFMLQSDLSAPSRQAGADQSVGGPSRAMRDLPYGDFDIDRGVDRMHEMGVRYYLAFSPNSVDEARNHEDLIEVATATPWVVFETQASLVEPLDISPVVIDGVRNHQDQWLDVGIEWFHDVTQARPASSGPAEWDRVGAEEIVSRYEAENTRLAGSIGEGGSTLSELLPETVVETDTTVSNVVAETDRISFSVDQIGTPVLVRASYFPTWKARGAEGPYRVAPNFMVVVPTEQNVEVYFARTATDWLSILLTFVGMAGLAASARGLRPTRVTRVTPAPVTLAPDETFGTQPHTPGEGTSNGGAPPV